MGFRQGCVIPRNRGASAPTFRLRSGARSVLNLLESHVMKLQKIRSVFLLIGLLGVGRPALSETLLLNVSSTVVFTNGPLPAGVTLGSTISAEIRVDLTHLPSDSDPSPLQGAYSYFGGGIPGYTFRIDTGREVLGFDSFDAANTPGTGPGIFLYKQPTRDALVFQMRVQDNPWSM